MMNGKEQNHINGVTNHSTSDQISENEINRFSSHYSVKHSSANSYDRKQTPVSKFNLLPEAERRLLLYTWNELAENICTTAQYLHQSFEEQVERNSSAIAVVHEEEQLSYGSLNERANQLAHLLIAKGVRPDDLIALCMERSTKMIVAMLGVLKAGGAYVPLDPAHSSQRLNNILHDANPLYLLIDAKGRAALGEHQVPVIDLDSPLPANLPIDNPHPIKLGLAPQNLAYVIYTSGSTGTPKGVMVEHQHVARIFEVTRDKFDFNDQDKWCLFHSYSFDVSVWEIWGALFYGSQLVIVPYKIIRSAPEFYDSICANGVTVLNQTPSAFKMLMHAKDNSLHSDQLRYVILAGEELDPSIPKNWYTKYSTRKTVLVNMYGPTETSIYATYQRLETSEDFYSIGRPLSDLRSYLLDANGDPVSLGAEGELYIGGAGVARGYLNRPELTTERFLLDPFNKTTTTRMYRTGDRARYLPDGNLVYLGRGDQQVKIRGFRIELGEIEFQLLKHPLVCEAIVHTWGNDGDIRLVAYVVADSDPSLSKTLRDYLSKLLPEYMIPVAYMCLSSLPLTINGKLDRRALPAIDDEAFVRQIYEPPQGEMEEKLAVIWSDLMNIKRISRNDNFFALGGHSLLIVRLLAQLRQIGLNTNARAVFDSQNLASLAATIDKHQTVNIPPNLINENTSAITPNMLPLINLSKTEIASIVAQIPGGVANIQDIYGLVPLQHGILFHHLMAEKGDPYLTATNLKFTDREALDRYTVALQLVIERHDIMRTSFVWLGLNEPAQVVLRQVPSILTEVTFNDKSEPVIEQLKRRFYPRYYRLDLTRPPLLRLFAAKTSDGEWMALQLMHHIIGDNITTERLYSEVQSILEGHHEQLEMPIPFRNLVAQVRLGLTSDDHTSFFTEMFCDIDEPTMPFGLKEIHFDVTEVNQANLTLPEELNNQLREHARHMRVTLASLFHLAWAQVLARSTGSESVVFGTVLLGRLQVSENNGTIMGPMINTLPLRLDVDETSVETAVRNTHSRLSALLTHEHASLALAQRCSNVSNDVPLFTALLNYRHNIATVQFNESATGVNLLNVEERTSYPITLSVDDDVTSLSLTAQVIAPLSAERICTYMQQALVSLATSIAFTPQQQVRSLTIIPLEERELLLHTWNQTEISYQSSHCLHQLFEEQVERNSSAIAVVHEEERLSYGCLNEKANQLAHFLIAKGVKPDDLIALCMERSTKMIVAILGVLKAGGAYIPLDPAHSSQRLNNIVHDAKPIYILVDAIGCTALGEHQVPILDLNQAMPNDFATHNPDSTKLGLTPQNLAYVIYTSGSTGVPKGVMVEHQQVTRLFHALNDKFSFNNQDKWSLFHSFAFDFSVWEIWGALAYGGQLKIVPYNITRSALELFDWICTSNITVLNQTPSAFKMLMQAKTNSLHRDQLRYVIFGGEELDPLIGKEWFEKYTKSQTVLVNMYGITETTVHATYQRLETLEDFYSIGRPISDLRSYLLNANGDPVPLGAEGELYIGGAGVARGYLNQPELTTKRFLLDPFNKTAATRMYRTGDRARYLPDGNLVYLGRGDQQVKIRGFRIELGEIEFQLLKHPLVREAIVHTWGNGSDIRLVAYVVADSQPSLSKTLRDYLSKLLPEYMIPVAYMCLSSMPLTINGKLDRRALPAIDDEAFVRQIYEPPQGEMEEKLAVIWSDLMNIKRISRNDNFFALGGHSLLIVRLLAQLRQIGLNTNARAVFDSQNLASLAATIDQHQTVNIPPNLINENTSAITPNMLPLINLSKTEIASIVAQIPGGVANIQDIYGLVPLQHGILFHHLMAEKGDPYLTATNIKFTDREALDRYTVALQLVIERHDIMRTSFVWLGLNEPAQVVLRQVPSILTEVTSNDTGEPVIEQLRRRFHPRYYRLDLTRPPLLRLFAAQTSDDGEWMALQLMHHIIGDNITTTRLYSEVQSILEGHHEQLRMSIPFRNLVAQVHLEHTSDDHTSFFTDILSDINEPTMPFGLKEINFDVIEVNQANLKLPQELNNQLREHARHLRVTLASLCHLAWAQVLALSSGNETVVFGTVLLGRLQVGEQNGTMMGPMINTLPLRLDVDETNVETAVRNTHSRLSALLTHEHASLALAQRCSNVSNGLPLFTTLLNYRHNIATVQFNESATGVNLLNVEERTSYPITLSVDDDVTSLSLTAQVIAPLSAERICAYMQQALVSLATSIASTPQQQVRSLTIIPLEERELLLHTWNQTEISYQSSHCLHQLFEEQVERNSSAIAVVHEDEQLSYGCLNEKANQLAHFLIAKGVKPDDLIALCVERSTTMIVAILGVLKAGGAYIPLDPAHSSQRLNNIVHDAKPIYILVDAIGRTALGEHQVPILDLNQAMPNDFATHNPDSTKLGLTPQNLAYVIYTSGSTGVPKGVMVEHQQVTRLFHALNDKFSFNNQDKWSLFHSFAFDFSVWEIWGALAYGGQLKIVPYNITRSALELFDWICTSNITVLNQTPSAFKMLMQAKTNSLHRDQLRYVIFGGEELDPLIGKEWFEKYTKSQTVLVNMYGITETTVHATYQRLETLEDFYSIGRPISDLRSYLLNANGDPVPLGAEGELYIGGAGVARGYLNQPELTTKRFLLDPFNKTAATRMYRTGDRARYLPDGNLVYLGRGDQQVKIRGFRIELGEIEFQLLKHPLVREAIVHTWGNGSDIRLVAYVVADSDPSLSKTLRDYLSRLLPEYMVPVAYMCLSSLPLTVNGKLDRRALPAIDDEAFVRQIYEPPQGEMEEKLAVIWSDLMNIKRISRNDNFFALGGHSLLIVRLLAQLRQIGLNTNAREVFDSQNLASLATTLDKHQALNIPPNLINENTSAITPNMLPLINLSETEIASIVAQIPGGVANIQDIYGLVPLQHGILFHHLMAEKGDPYLTATNIKFTDREALDRYTVALQLVIERHDIMRTSFVWLGLNEPAQVVLRQVPSILTEVTSNDTGEPVIEQLRRRFHPRYYRLDLTRPPLLRLFATQTSDGGWMALQLMHHIVDDNVSLQTLYSEVQSIFEGHHEQLKMPIPFRNLVAQVRLSFSSDKHTSFFTEMFSDINEPTMPFGLKEIHFDVSEVNEANLTLPQELNNQLREHARNLRVTLASLCHLAWAQVLALSSGSEAVVFGTVLLGRLQVSENNGTMMGPMINTLPLRLDVDETSVETAVRNTHTRLSALLTHEHASLALAQRCSNVSNGLPLFTALLNYRHNITAVQINESATGVKFLNVEERTSYPITLSVDDDVTSLSLTAQVIAPLSAERICAYMQQALVSLAASIACAPQQPVRSLTIIPPEERKLLLHTWNQTENIYPSTCFLHQLFEEQVERNSSAIAVVHEEEQLSYGSLNERANQLAHFLIAKGVKPDELIVLCMERSTKMIVAILGVLKAGGAYVPLDPAHSSQRLNNILHDANPLYLLIDAKGRGALGEHQIPVIDLDSPLPANLPIDNPHPIKLGLAPQNLAYVIYTSGSTGTPKGVMVEHQHVARIFEVTRDKFDFNDQDKWCLFHSYSFDVSVWEIWGALFYGSQLVIVPYKIIRSATEFYDSICANGVTVLNQTPSAFKMLMHAKNNSLHSDQLRYVILAGEELDPSIPKNWYTKYSTRKTVLVNMYGPTETSIYATYQRLETSEDFYSIGRPLSDLRSYLLDANGDPVPLGAEGELYVGGAGVARGYLNRPELTTERFLLDPFNKTTATRMYRTGDRARYLPDGNLIYLGRGDQQVKIRGFRIELGEIEFQLLKHPLVREAIVHTWGNGSDIRLVAYVVADSDPSLSKTLRDYLSKLLPEYMIPVAYMCLSSLPLTINGKLDRRALPAIDDEAFVRQIYEPPQGEMEEKLAAIWSDLMNIKRISRNDNFFALGGHSLLIVRLLAQLRQIGLNTNARAVFDSQNLASLAAILDKHEAVNIPPNIINENTSAITPNMLPLINLSKTEIASIVAQIPGGVANIQDIYGLVPLQHGILFHHLMAEKGDPYLTATNLKFTDREALDRYTVALQLVIERHDIMRTSFVWLGLNEPAQVVLRQVPSILTEVAFNDKSEPVIEQLKRRFYPRYYRLDLTRPPLLRLFAAKTSDGEWMALQLMHHIIGDNITTERLYSEVESILEGHHEQLEMPIPFRNLVAQVRLGLTSDDHTSFFTEMLSDINEPTMPFGLKEINFDVTELNQANLTLPEELNNQLREHARHMRVTLASLFHLAWAQVLARSSGSEAVVFGTVLLGRLQVGEQNGTMMGPMINTLPFRLDVDETSVETSVRSTHSRLSALLTHEHASLAFAQRCSNVLNGLPLFTALLNYRRNNQSFWNVNELRSGVIVLSSEGRTNYPLSLSVDDNGDSLSLAVEVVSPLSAEHICAYMQQALVSLSTSIAFTPQQQVRSLTIIPPEERKLLLHTWNQTEISYPSTHCLHQLFEEQVERNSSAIAVVHEGEQLSYGCLNESANQLAHFLIAKGVKPDDLIALCMERSTKMIVAILGVLKAGGAYVPLDPAYPSQRLTNILNDATPLYLLTDAIGRKALGKHQVPVIDLDNALPATLSICNPHPIKLGLTPQNLVYVIYTSGSTGTPKGVMVEHRNITNFIYWCNGKFTENEFAHTLFSTSISFDMSGYECFVPLSMGKTIHIVADAIKLTKIPSNISLINTVPSVITTLLNEKCFSSSQYSLHLVGEPLTNNLINRIFMSTKVTQLYNLYGPSETVIFSTLHRYKPGDVIIESIGRPIANTQIYLLDANGDPVPLGAEGELFIGGAGVARGYLNQPELTAERFLLNPFNKTPATRMYRTGDRARYLPDGNLAYLGRVDQQVKIRGFRIELGEIESQLLKHPLVREAIVHTWGNGSDIRLVAYVVADSDPSLSEKLRDYLSNLLPNYMVPVAYMCLSSLPLTPNGKLNRRALPSIDDEAFVRQIYEAPQGDMEEKLAAIWSNLMNIKRISRNDNFFALGGHSLLIVRLLAQLRQIGLNTNARAVFDSQNLATLAATLDKHQTDKSPPNLINENTTVITPNMLPLINLSTTEIASIVAQIPGGVANIQDIYGLVPLQHGILFHHLMAEKGDPYLTVTNIKFTDREALDRYTVALQLVIERHDIMRTSFVWLGLNEPAQVVLRQVDSILTEVTLYATSEEVIQQLRRRFHPRYHRLDLSRPPLLRLFAAKTSDGEWMALQLMHHIIGDNITTERLYSEVQSILEGHHEQLEMPIPFRNLVAQVRLGLTSDDHTSFFTEMLSDINEPTMPFGLKEINFDLTEVNQANLTLPQELNSQLREHARHLRVTLASLCHLAWAQVLALSSGSEAVVFGTVLLGRLQVGEQNGTMMGPMINTLPLRLDVDETSVETAVRNTHSRLSALLTHEHASLALAQRCSNVSNGLPLFTALLNYRRNNQSFWNVNELHSGVIVLSSEGRTNYPLSLSVDDNGDSLGLAVEVVSPLSAERICAYMQQALVSLAASIAFTPQQQVRSLTIIPQEERKLLLHTWNQTENNNPPTHCLHQLFEEQVERSSSAIAVVDEEEQLSYRSLNEKANQLAHFLIAKGVKPDDLIAICVERSTKMIVAILGVLKAGCAYVPLDPSYPSQRLTNILKDANPVYLLADATGQKTLGTNRVLLIDLDQPLTGDLSINNPDSIKFGLSANHLAYVIYTSGSTGTPKGVMVEHYHAVQLVKSVHDQLDFNELDTWSLSHSFAFDFSVWEMWGALCYGNKVTIAPFNTTRSTNDFYKWICNKNVTVLSQTPSALKMLIQAKINSAHLDQLRYIIIGGEALDPLIVNSWYEHCGKSKTVLVNGYGPTETVVFATSWICDARISENRTVPIGRPLANKRIYLLDEHGQPVPFGAEGELYIGGAGIARGYLNRPELTSERFSPDPFSEKLETRMYRTGDRGRYLPDGNLIYLGRSDEQVKIRGFRIELGEIEAHLMEYSTVREAVVHAFGNGPDTRLVAYVVAEPDTSLPQYLRSHLSTLLPDYMVPVAYVCLSSLPLTRNGKLERRALPAPDDEAFVRQTYEGPQGEVEEKLAAIWSDLMNIEHISRHDNFFELGGNSLLVMQFINQAKLHSIHIENRGVFSFPILKDLAKEIAVGSKRLCSDVVTPICRKGNHIPLFLLPDGTGDITYAYELAHDIDNNVPIYALPWLSPDKEQPQSIEEMANRMIDQIKNVCPNGPCAIAGYSSGGILGYEITRHLLHSHYPVSFLGLIDTYSQLPESNNVTQTFLNYLSFDFPHFEVFNDSTWLDQAKHLNFNEFIEKLKKSNTNLENTDIDWLGLINKQRCNYQNMCATYKIHALPLKIDLFKATEFETLNNKYFDEKLIDNAKRVYNCPKLGWEVYEPATNVNVININGNHQTMITDPINRSLLGKEISQLLLKIEYNLKL